MSPSFLQSLICLLAGAVFSARHETMLKVYTVATGFMGLTAYGMVYILSRLLT